MSFFDENADENALLEKIVYNKVNICTEDDNFFLWINAESYDAKLHLKLVKVAKSLNIHTYSQIFPIVKENRNLVCQLFFYIT